MTRPLQILHCLWHGEIGGAERAVCQLVREQLRDPELAPALLFAQAGGLNWKRALRLGCPVITLGLPHGHALRRLPTIVSAMRAFDVHHFHSAELLLMVASLLCPKARRVYTHRGGRFDYALKKRLLHETAGILLRFFFHRFSGNTSHGARCGARQFHLPQQWFQVTYNGVEFDLLNAQRSRESVRAELGLSHAQYVIGTAANLRPWKRIDRLLHAVAALADLNVFLLIVGDGVDRPRLEAITKELGISTRVIFAGRQSCMADYLQTMDAFCLPSSDSESFGNAAVEAMAMGLPTIVFADSGGLVEHIQPHRTGFIVAQQSELDEALRDLIMHRELGHRLGQHARAAVLERYAPTRSAAAFKTLYS